MNYGEYVLTKLEEECAEIIQRCAKQKQFGPEEREPGQELTNRQRLQGEVYDFFAAVQLLERVAGRSPSFTPTPEVQAIMDIKHAKMEKYFRYSVELGTVTA